MSPLTASLPTAELEEWRYSRVGDLDLGRYTVVDAPATGTAPAGALVALRAMFPAPSTVVSLSEGRVTGIEFDPTGASAGLSIEIVERGATRPLSSVPSPDAFDELNDSASDVVVIDIAAGSTIPGPIVVIGHVATSGVLSCPRVLVRAGADSDATVIEWSGSADVDALVVPVTELDLAPSARLRHVGVQMLGSATWQIGRLAAKVGQSATLRCFHVALGGSYARLRFDIDLTGRGAHGEVSAIYFGDGDQMHDLRTFQRHDARDTTSNLLFKGAVAGSAHAVYTGLIRIDETAAGSNADQSNRIVKLSPDTWAESVPNLEIHNNDVHCSHASAVGPIDPDQRFYLESRGVPPMIAERLVVAGFFGEVIESIGVAEIAGPIIDEVSARLEKVL